jgi:hypothetical protein
MRKSFIVLLAIFVCVLVTTVGVAQTHELDATTSYQGRLTADSQATANLAGPVLTSSGFSSADIVARISEAKELLGSKLDSPTLSRDSVRLAALDPDTSQLDIFSLAKDEFLTKDADLTATTQYGRKVHIHVTRANGVNTAVTVTDVATGQSLVPLTVQFPIIRKGAVSEVAYYTSAHAALLSPEVTSAGESYVDTVLDKAAQNLAQHGVEVPADIVEVAEHLCIVEHTDQKRFTSELHSTLFPEILSLYALNQGNTFRYSVSSAGAGGMIQMIPRTYEMIRKQHPTVLLNSDFVNGMRDHANALEAMLLYMNDTWSGLEKSVQVQDALRSGTATKAELLAAGYNSNPVRLPVYLKNGGAEWRTLIPTETQMYLAIYSSVDKNIDLETDNSMANNWALLTRPLVFSTEPKNSLSLSSWIGQLLIGTHFRRLALCILD